MRDRFDLILVGYREADTRAALRFCATTFPAALVRRRILVLNRPDLLDIPDLRPRGWDLLAGSNMLGEFSGWQEGLDRLECPVASSGVLFLNDTVNTHGRFLAWRKLALLLEMRRATGAGLIGFKDPAPTVFEIAGLPFREWVSSYCFALTRSALERLQQRLYEPDVVARVVPGGLDEATFFSEMSPPTEARIRWGIFGGGWHGSERLRPDNSARLQFKARCIAAEFLLSARCEALHIATTDPMQRHRLAARADLFQQRVYRYVARKLGRPGWPTTRHGL